MASYKKPGPGSIGEYRCIKADGYHSSRPARDPGTADPAKTNRKTNIHAKKDDPGLDQALWWIRGNDLKIWYNYIEDSTDRRTGKEGSLELSDEDLFSALSCFHKIDSRDHNIFSYSAKEGNEKIFELAFNLLKESCEKADLEKAGCARALMCWSSWQENCFLEESSSALGPECSAATGHTEKTDSRALWRMAEGYDSDLEKDGSTEYNNCRAVDFYDFFD